MVEYSKRVIFMIRIWAKTIKNGRIVKQYLFEREGETDYSEFFDYLKSICEALDIPTPVLIKTHLFNYAKYNNVKFKQDDFVENIHFDKLILENALL
ncbi:MAG: hypothetical protein J5911_06400 [Clostridia bacterium]|nr:hypothetical protein [Clostridia bacterium]